LLADGRFGFRGISGPRKMTASRFGVVIVRRTVVLLLILAGSLPAAGRVTWKIEERAQLQIGGHVPISWNVYTIEKKKNLVLILLGKRYLALDTKTKSVWQIETKDLTAKGKDFESDEPGEIGTPIPVLSWSARDVGPAERILITLGDYGAKIELALPHMIDLRRGIY
jgi:hypothetical protein